MDEVAKGRFKWKFYKLTLLLNLVVLFIALAVVLAVIGPAAYRIPAVVIFPIGAAFLSLHLLKQYKSTKNWLEEQG
jgi:hypothetical protein